MFLHNGRFVKELDFVSNDQAFEQKRMERLYLRCVVRFKKLHEKYHEPLHTSNK